MAAPFESILKSTFFLYIALNYVVNGRFESSKVLARPSMRVHPSRYIVQPMLVLIYNMYLFGKLLRPRYWNFKNLLLRHWQ